MKDRIVAGGLAGIAGSVVQEGYAIGLAALEYTDRSYGDMAFCLLTGTCSENTMSDLVGVLANLAIGILLGVVFALIIRVSSDKYLYLKSFLYGWVLWMLFISFGVIFKLPHFQEISPDIALIMLGGSLLWALVTAYTLRLIDHMSTLL